MENTRVPGPMASRRADSGKAPQCDRRAQLAEETHVHGITYACEVAGQGTLASKKHQGITQAGTLLPGRTAGSHPGVATASSTASIGGAGHQSEMDTLCPSENQTLQALEGGIQAGSGATQRPSRDPDSERPAADRGRRETLEE